MISQKITDLQKAFAEYELAYARLKNQVAAFVEYSTERYLSEKDLHRSLSTLLNQDGMSTK